MLKFKLKKDGKTVGYLRFASEPAWKDGKFIEVSCDNEIWILYHTNIKLLGEFDSVHQFVCLDCDDREVYLGDIVVERRTGAERQVVEMHGGYGLEVGHDEEGGGGAIPLCSFGPNQIRLVKGGE